MYLSAQLYLVFNNKYFLIDLLPGEYASKLGFQIGKFSDAPPEFRGQMFVETWLNIHVIQNYLR